MLSEMFRPYRSATSLRRLALALAGTLVPLVGALWFTGWTLEHHRNTAWGVGDELPDIQPLGDKLVPGMWGSIVTAVWMLPASVMMLVVGAAVTASSMTEMLGSQTPLSAFNQTDPLAMQVEISTAVAETLAPAMTWVIAAALLSSLVVMPFAQAAVSRYSIFRTPSTGFQIGGVLSSMRRGGIVTVRTWIVSAAPTLLFGPLFVVLWSQLGADLFKASMVLDSEQMARTTFAYFIFYIASTAAGLLGSALNPAIMGAWGSWARQVYAPDSSMING